MTSLPVKPLFSGHILRRNLIIPAVSPAMVTTSSSRNILGVSLLCNNESMRNFNKSLSNNRRRLSKNGGVLMTAVASAEDLTELSWDSWKPDKSTVAPSLSDVIWPAAGAFAAMAIMGKIDQMLNPKGISMSVAPLGAVCAILFTTPTAPAAKKYNMFMAQIGCAAIGVLAFSIFGPGWLARSTSLAASIAFMVIVGANHPPAASLPLLFIDGAKFQKLSFWYTLFPGAAACLILCLLQEIVSYLKEHFKF